MAVQLAGILAPALAKVGAVKLPLLLRAAGITAGALPGLRQGNLGQAIVGGGLGAFGSLVTCNINVGRFILVDDSL